MVAARDPSGRPSVRRLTRRRGLAPVVLAILLLGQQPVPALADHGGRSIGSLLTCDRPVNPPRCTSVGNDPWHFVHLDASLGAGLAQSLRDSMAEDYDPTYLTMVEQPAITRVTDVVAYAADYGENGAAGWVYCPSDAPQGLNPQGDRWCQRQEIHFNLNPRYVAFFADDQSTDHIACHELGHTLGLRHWGNPPQSRGPAAATCMNVDTPDGPTALHQLDRDHIRDYYAAPKSVLRPQRHAPTIRRPSAADGLSVWSGPLIHAAVLDRLPFAEALAMIRAAAR
ncbi:MAG: hypothetical protein ACRDHD_05045 [Candidatus Limnocylindria bacterium]